MNIDEYIKTSDALFHYTKTSTAIEQILYTKEFKLSSVKDTNDPREYKFHLFHMAWNGWYETDVMSDLHSKAHPIIERILKDECRLMCFCTNNKPTLILSDGRSIKDKHVCSEGWSKSRMWSQYGQNHYGICLVFSKKELERVLSEKKSQIKAYQADYVKYSEKYGFDWKTITLDGNRLEDEGVEEYSYNHVIEHSDELFFRKHIDYRDEAEFRVVVFDPDKKLQYLDACSLIKCVIVGDRTSEVYIPLINQMCADLNIGCRRVYWDRGNPHLHLCKST